MGFYKQLQIKIDEGGADPSVIGGRCVCPDCFDEPGIQDFIRGNVSSDTCNFCGATNDDEVEIAADLELVLDHIVDCMRLEWDDPNNCVGWDSGEGGWQGAKIYETEEAFEAADVIVGASSGDLLDVMVEALGLGRQFCERNPYSLRENERLIGGWYALAERLKHETRFFFLRDDDGGNDDYVSPSEILMRLGDEVTELDLVTRIPAGTKFYRVRFQNPGEHYEMPADLGPPPAKFSTKSNRMSPPGIVMTYLAEDPNTALAETQTGPGTYGCGVFEILRDIEVIDLSTIPVVPSLFDADRNIHRSAIRFLRDFAADVSKPIAHDDRVHVEYIPTQVITEYFREVFAKDHFPVQGLRYTSAPCPAHSSVVLFADQRDVEGTDANTECRRAPLLRLVDRSEIVVE